MITYKLCNTVTHQEYEYTNKSFAYNELEILNKEAGLTSMEKGDIWVIYHHITQE